MANNIPVGVGSQGIIPTKEQDLEDALQLDVVEVQVSMHFCNLKLAMWGSNI